MTVKSSELAEVLPHSLRYWRVSSATMLWLFWKHPLATAGVTFAILTVLGTVSARYWQDPSKWKSPIWTSTEARTGKQRLY